MTDTGKKLLDICENEIGTIKEKRHLICDYTEAILKHLSKYTGEFKIAIMLMRIASNNPTDENRIRAGEYTSHISSIEFEMVGLEKNLQTAIRMLHLASDAITEEIILTHFVKFLTSYIPEGLVIPNRVNSLMSYPEKKDCKICTYNYRFGCLQNKDKKKECYHYVLKVKGGETMDFKKLSRMSISDVILEYIVIILWIGSATCLTLVFGLAIKWLWGLF